MDHLATQVQTQLSREETQTLLAWLCPLSSAGAYVSLETALSRRAPGTGSWFLKSAVFQAWLYTQHDSIWISGLPGSGKTLLCASAMDAVRTHHADKTAVLIFFFDHRDPTKLTHENFTMSIMRQLLNLSPECMDYAKKYYEEKGSKGDRSFNRSEALSMIEQLLGNFEQAFILCDALDEATEGDTIIGSLERLYSYGKAHQISVKVLFTSRFDIQTERRHILITSNRIALTENMRPDIESYVERQLHERLSTGKLKLRDRGLMQLIQNRIVLRAGT